MKTSSFLAATLLVSMGLFATPTYATPITIDVTYNGMANGADNINATYQGKSSNVLAGMISFKYSNVSDSFPFTLDKDLLAFCIEFSQLLTTNKPMTYTVTAADQWFSAHQTDAITRLYTRFGKETGTSSTDAAFQLALWELIYDYNGTNVDNLALSSGNFKINNSKASTVLAQNWLSELVNVKSTYSMYVMTNEFSQNQLIFNGNIIRQLNEPLPVSAPATLGIFGLGLLGLALRRRQR
ncbi:hypothetical protein VT06_06520 [Arsukibacterium sp. MJ3]|uniref:PEP-CTERM sorting domain-containing protein n=1 Tax=Arsukibacterium sp. MJ3 TaxID=1632859 RepID=UPI0006273F49|nr:PEP-CTERM sorting domain-containing protein [Arsukibacterium sp. MJ3]KKO49478.1 hypothetical protein VT06_06520 [Arsukibacterium sp. MJ3]